MSFRLYSGNPFTNRHEEKQFSKILELLIEKFENSETYCYCLYNFNYGKQEGKNGQFDVVLFFKHSIIVLELKSQAGKLTGSVDLNYGNPPIKIQFSDGQIRDIPIRQIEKEHKNLQGYFSGNFRKYREKPETEKYRVDVLLVFNKLFTNTVEINNPQIKRWFNITTIENISETIDKIIEKKQPFTIKPEDVEYIARFYRLKQIDPLTRKLYKTAFLNLFTSTLSSISLEDNEAYKTQQILQDLSDSIGEENVQKLLKNHSNVSTIRNDEEKAREFREQLKLLEKTDIHYKIIEDLITERFLSTLYDLVSEIVEGFKSDTSFLDVLSFDTVTNYITKFSELQSKKSDMLANKDLDDPRHKRIDKALTLLSLLSSIENQFDNSEL